MLAKDIYGEVLSLLSTRSGETTNDHRKFEQREYLFRVSDSRYPTNIVFTCFRYHDSQDPDFPNVGDKGIIDFSIAANQNTQDGRWYNHIRGRNFRRIGNSK